MSVVNTNRFRIKKELQKEIQDIIQGEIDVTEERRLSDEDWIKSICEDTKDNPETFFRIMDDKIENTEEELIKCAIAIFRYDECFWIREAEIEQNIKDKIKGILNNCE